MEINWKLKSFVFGIIDKYSLYRLLYLLQKWVTRRSVIKIQAVNPCWEIHGEHLRASGAESVIEFGAGKSLAQNLFLSKSIGKQTLVDIFPMLDLSEVNSAASQIGELLGSPFPTIASTEELRDKLNIDYKAPFYFDERSFPDDSFDACISTNTLEHIPLSEIVIIFKALKKKLKDGGIVSAVIDYSDHYSHTDSSITGLNFLRYSDEEFDKFNHKCHFQNRLRHRDYETVFKDLGFTLLKSIHDFPVELPDELSDEFDKDEPSLKATRGIFLLSV